MINNLKTTHRLTTQYIARLQHKHIHQDYKPKTQTQQSHQPRLTIHKIIHRPTKTQQSPPPTLPRQSHDFSNIPPSNDNRNHRKARTHEIKTREFSEYYPEATASFRHSTPRNAIKELIDNLWRPSFAHERALIWLFPLRWSWEAFEDAFSKIWWEIGGGGWAFSVVFCMDCLWLVFV